MFFWIKLIPLVLVFFALQITLIETSVILNFNLLFILFVFIGMFEVFHRSIIATFFCGILYDLMSPYIFGIYTFALLLVLFLIRIADYKLYKNSLYKKVFIIGASFLLFNFIFIMILKILNLTDITYAYFYKDIVYCFLGTIFISPFLLIILHRIFKYELQD